MRPCEELVQAPGIQPVLPLGEYAERPPHGGLAFHAEAEDLRLFEVAERGPCHQVAVELEAPGLLARPGREHLAAADRDLESAHDREKRGPIFGDLGRQPAQDHRGLGPGLGGHRQPPCQLHARGRAGQMVVEVDA
jgi:hypothetical protein